MDRLSIARCYCILRRCLSVASHHTTPLSVCQTGLVSQYLMKAELLWLPIVGWKAVLARDIFVHRQTQSSFRRLLKSATRSLQAGNSIMTFPGAACRIN